MQTNPKPLLPHPTRSRHQRSRSARRRNTRRTTCEPLMPLPPPMPRPRPWPWRASTGPTSHSLFSLYDRGVCMDAEDWYSATPEAVVAAQAAHATPAGLVVDAFASVGGNSIQFAARGCYMVAVEIDPRKVELAAHNARIYGVEDRIEFMLGNFFHLAPFLKADLVFLSPPWGGPSYNQTPIYTLDMLKPKDGYAIFQAAQGIAPNIVMFLPRNVDIRQVEKLTWLSSPPLDFESEENHIQHRFKGITAYFGNTAEGPSSLLKQR